MNTSIGYAMKKDAWALRGAMDHELRCQRLGVTQYACLELLHQRPGISNAELARGAFTSGQATHQLLHHLSKAGLIERHGQGRSPQLSLTQDGSALLNEASRAVAEVEERMISALDSRERDMLLTLLRPCAESLAGLPL